jgi:hypothetical protein
MLKDKKFILATLSSPLTERTISYKFVRRDSMSGFDGAKQLPSNCRSEKMKDEESRAHHPFQWHAPNKSMTFQ